MTRKHRRNPKSKPDIFRNLPSEVIIDIISRLPIRAIGSCKCVCKSWRRLLQTREFVDFHLSKSVPALLIGHDWNFEIYKILEFDDELGLESHDLHYNQIAKFDFTGLGHADLKVSANGLLLFVKQTPNSDALFSDALYVCNPLTREYIQLPPDGDLYDMFSSSVTYGFGVSKMTGQHKAVKIFHGFICDHVTDRILTSTKSFGIAYTLGTGVWRSIAVDTPFLYDILSNGVSLNGNLHWLVKNALDESHCISCFDLETETFSTFSPPLLLPAGGGKVLVSLVVLRDCLCVCDSTPVDEIVIWSMRDYDEKSWTKEFVLTKSNHYFTDYDDDDRWFAVYPIKIFKDGDILMTWHDLRTFYYSNKTKTTEEFDLSEVERDEWDSVVVKGEDGMSAVLYTPSFLSLASFPDENLSEF